MRLSTPTDNEMLTGWQVGDVHVPPPTAYTRKLDWFNDFLWRFPEKAERMRKAHAELGRTHVVFAKQWLPAVISWLNRHYT